MTEIELIDNSAEVLAAKEQAIIAALEAVGQQAVSHAKQNITREGRVDTSAMRDSVNHQVVASEDAVYVGTNQEYAIYHEYGTGIYADGGRGRQTPWRYQDKRGEWHTTRGIKAIHFLQNAAQDHVDEYKNIVESILKGE